MAEEQPKKTSKIKKIGLAILIIFTIFIGIGVAATFVKLPEIEWEIEQPYKGFYTGIKLPDRTRLFIFYEHPEWGMDVLVRGKILHSNEIIIYTYSPKTQTLNLKLKSYLLREKQVTIKQGNQTITKTIQERYDQQEETVKLKCSSFDFEKNTVTLPSTTKKRYYEIWFEGRKVFEFKHRTYQSWILAPALTYGEMFKNIAGYIIGTVIICFAALGSAKAVIGKVHYVPDIPTWILMLLPVTLVLIFGMGLYWVTYEAAITNAAWLYIPVFIIFFFISLYFLREKPQIYMFMRDIKSRTPAKQIIQKLIVTDEDGKIFLAPETWRQFLSRKRKKLEIVAEDQEFWSYEVPGFPNFRIFYFESYTEMSDHDFVKLAKIHYKDLDEYRSDITGFENVAKAYREIEHKYFKLRAEKETLALRQAGKLAAELLLGLKRGRLPEIEEKKKEQKEEEKEAESKED